MNYEEKYNNIVSTLQSLINDGKKQGHIIIRIEDIENSIHELKEMDELTWLTKYIEEEAYYLSIDIRDEEDRIKLKNLKRSLAWLEKQCEQNPVNNVEPKFKVGDWITDGNITIQIEAIKNDCYLYCGDCVLYSTKTADKVYHLWSIEDVKDGDVISNGEMMVIFKKFEEPSYKQHIVAYIGLDTNGNIQITDDTWTLGIDKAKPATKEQCDFLFFKMKEEGYEWNADKKELKKAIIEPKFKAGDWIVWQDKCYKVNYNGCGYELVDQNGLSTSLEYRTIDEGAHLWTIQDANDGDVLVCDGKYGQEIGIVKKYIGKFGGCDKCFETYCFVDWDGIFRVGEYMGSRKIHPATKEQRDTLFARMKEAGYEWDDEKKELKNIEDERIRQALIELVKYSKKSCFEILKDKPFNVVSMDAMLAWLEKIKDKYEK